MFAHRRVVQVVSFFAIVSMLLGSAPVATWAQEGGSGSIYLPSISAGTGLTVFSQPFILERVKLNNVGTPSG